MGKSLERVQTGNENLLHSQGAGNHHNKNQRELSVWRQLESRTKDPLHGLKLIYNREAHEQVVNKSKRHEIVINFNSPQSKNVRCTMERPMNK